MGDIEAIVVLGVVDALLVALFFLLRVLPWTRPGPWRLIWLMAGLTSLLFITGELVALVAGGSALSTEHQLPLFGAILAISTALILVYMHGQRAEERALALAETDPLCGIANSRGFEHRIEALVRNRDAFALIYVDLDGLKAINDEFGHQRGDEVLRQCAEALARSVRAGELAARIGGDEFALVLPGADAVAAQVVAERALTAIRATSSSGPHPVTASIGVAVSEPSSSTSQMIRAADAAMYRAKSAGGDRIAHLLEAVTPA